MLVMLESGSRVRRDEDRLAGPRPPPPPAPRYRLQQGCQEDRCPVSGRSPRRAGPGTPGARPVVCRSSPGSTSRRHRGGDGGDNSSDRDRAEPRHDAQQLGPTSRRGRPFRASCPAKRTYLAPPMAPPRLSFVWCWAGRWDIKPSAPPRSFRAVDPSFLVSRGPACRPQNVALVVSFSFLRGRRAVLLVFIAGPAASLAPASIRRGHAHPGPS